MDLLLCTVTINIECIRTSSGVNKEPDMYCVDLYSQIHLDALRGHENWIVEADIDWIIGLHWKRQFMVWDEEEVCVIR